jgi:hypothetical protein
MVAYSSLPVLVEQTLEDGQGRAFMAQGRVLWASTAVYCREWRCRNASRVSIFSKSKQRLTPPTALALTGLSPYELTRRAVSGTLKSGYRIGDAKKANRAQSTLTVFPIIIPMSSAFVVSKGAPECQIIQGEYRLAQSPAIAALLHQLIISIFSATLRTEGSRYRTCVLQLACQHVLQSLLRGLAQRVNVTKSILELRYKQ